MQPGSNWGIGFFFTFGALPAANQSLVSKRNASGTEAEFLGQLRTGGSVRLTIWDGANTGAGPLVAETDPLTPGTYHVTFDYRNPSIGSERARVRINGGLSFVDTGAGVFSDSTNAVFRLFERDGDQYADVSIGNLVITDDLIDAALSVWLYNGGAGRTADEINNEAILGPINGAGTAIDFYELLEESGDGLSYTGLSDLTDVNNVGRRVLEPPRYGLTKTVVDNTLNTPDGQDCQDITGNGLPDVLTCEGAGKIYWHEQTAAGTYVRHTVRAIDRNFAQNEGGSFYQLPSGEWIILVGDAGNGDFLAYRHDGTPQGTWSQGLLLDGIRPDMQDIKVLPVAGALRPVYAWEGNAAGQGGWNWLEFLGGDPLLPASWADYVVRQRNGGWWIAPELVDYSTPGVRQDLVVGARNKDNPVANPGVFYLTPPADPRAGPWTETTIESTPAVDSKHVDVGNFFGNRYDVMVHKETNLVSLYNSASAFAKTDVPAAAQNNAHGSRRFLNGRELFITNDQTALDFVFWHWDNVRWVPVATQQANKMNDSQCIGAFSPAGGPDILHGDSFDNLVAYFTLPRLDLEETYVRGQGTAEALDSATVTFTPGGGGPTISPEPAIATSAAVDPNTMQGSIALQPELAAATSEAILGAAIEGPILLMPDAAISTSEAPDPTVVLGNIVLSPEFAAATTEALLGAAIQGSVNVTPPPAPTFSEAIAPNVQEGGNVDITPDPAISVSSAIDPVVVFGSLTLTLEFAAATGTAIDPAVTIGSLTLTPDVAEAFSEVISPSVDEGGGPSVTPQPAIAFADAIQPDIILGSVVVVLTSADALGAAVDPTVDDGTGEVADAESDNKGIAYAGGFDRGSTWQ